jgi:hypothetical protein
VAHRVVHKLELVEVDEHDRHLAVPAVGVGEHAFDVLDDECSVR